MSKKVLNKQEIKNLITEKLPILVDFDSTMVITDNFPNIVGENKPCVEVMKKWIDGIRNDENIDLTEQQIAYIIYAAAEESEAHSCNRS